MAGALDTAGLIELLEARETVLLPSARASGSLRQAFDREQRKRNLRAWESPPAHAWRQWTEGLWSQLVLVGMDDRLLLNSLQEQTLWESIVHATPEGERMLRGSLRQLAQLAQSAFALASSFEAVDAVSRAADNPDTRAYARWQQQLLERCRDQKMLSRSSLDAALGMQVSSLRLPPVLHLVGFDELPPAQTSLLKRLGESGVQVQRYSLRADRSGAAFGPSMAASIALSEPAEELAWAVQWIQQRFGASPDKQIRVALVLPDPAAERPALEPLLRAVLAPELEPVGVDLSSTPWHFSAGPPLGTVTMVRHALLLLRWLTEELPSEEIGTLLLSPYLGHADGAEQRARFDAQTLRTHIRLRPEWSFDAFLSSLRPGDPSFGELKAVHSMFGNPTQGTGSGSYADWTELIRKLLRAAGWPGQRTPSASEFVATEAWDGLLDSLATLDFSGGRVSFAEVLQRLESQAGSTPAPSTTPSAPVEILTLAETQGCVFDAVVVARASDDRLPSPERSHPLLSWDLQRRMKLPGTDPALGYERSRDRLESLLDRCDEVLLLRSASDDNGPLRPTHLAAELHFLPMSPEELLTTPSPAAPVPLESVGEDTYLPLSSLEIGGGARLLELQAACGFRAFAELRLGAEVPAGPTLGLDPRQRGSLLHHAMENFWKATQTQAALRSLTREERHTAVGRAVDEAFLRWRLVPAGAWDQAYLRVCERRLTSLVEAWLQHELERSDFTVLAPEQDQVVSVGPFHLKVRPDRIDRVEGGFVFVDYKTSADLSTEHWLGERPHAPQLPLYTLLAEPQEVRGLAFARLRSGKDMKWIGLQQAEGDLRQRRGIRLHDLALQRGEWREQLDRLAKDFADGVTTVDPKSYPHTCRYCEQRLLCRLDAAKLLADEDAEDLSEINDG